MTDELRIPQPAVTPETLRLLQAQIDAWITAWARFAEAVCELLAARFAEVARVLNNTAELVEAATRAPRPAWQCPYGPPQKRTRR